MSVRFKFMRYGESNDEGLYAAAKYWIRAVRSINEHINTSKILEFKYEEFCQDVHKYLKDCLSHTGLKSEKFPFEKISVVFLSLIKGFENNFFIPYKIITTSIDNITIDIDA